MRRSLSPDPPIAWVVLGACLIMLVMGQGSLYLVTVSLTTLAEAFDWPRQVPSLAYALGSFGAGVGAIYIARLAERVGMGWIGLGGAISCSAGVMLTSRIETPLELYLTYGLLVGVLGNGALFAPIIHYVSRWFDRHRGLSLGIIGSGVSLAGVIWPPIIGYLNETVGWRTMFLWYGMLSMALMLPMSVILHRRPPEPAAARMGHQAGQQDLVLGWPPRLVHGALCAAIVGCCVAMSLPIAHIVAYATDLGFSRAIAAELLSVMLGVSLISKVGGGVLADRMGGLRTLILGSALQALMLAVLAFTTDLAALYVVVALFGFGYGAIVPMYAFTLREYFSVQGSGQRIAMLFFFGLIGMAGGSYLGGLVYDLAGAYRPAFLMGVLTNVVNLAIIATLLRRASLASRHKLAAAE
ncbi:MAG: MFS transporter [Alphaproteobacteria bacterium]|nr:MFS transporter [Alphaproteobacteria bacterium]